MPCTTAHVARDLPISPPAIKGSPDGALPAVVSNGMIGLRVRQIPLTNGIAFVSGLSGTHPVTHVEAAAQAPYPLGADIWIDRVRLSDVLNRTTHLEQSYDFSCGELHSAFVFEVGDVRASVRVLTLCSRARPSVVLQEVALRVSRACKVTFRALIDPAGTHGRWRSRYTGTPGQQDIVDGAIEWETLGALSTCGMAYVTELRAHHHARSCDCRSSKESWATCQREEWGEQSPLVTSYTIARATAETEYVLRQLVSMIPSHLHNEPDRQATRMVALAHSMGFQTLRAENQAEWADLWKGRIGLAGAPRRWQALADAAFFYLNTSAHQSSPASISVFGLSGWDDYHYYYGHIMWDIETFLVPALIWFQPHAARALLDYRSERVPAARANARLNGRRGIQFPWESSPRRGEESSPGPGKASWHEDHVSADVALTFAQFAHATGDEEFWRQQAWPILEGVAEWIASRVEKRGRVYHLGRTMGIAERESAAENAAFAVMGMKLVLRAAIHTADRFRLPHPQEWHAVEKGLRLPIDRRTHVIKSYDNFDEHDEKAATPDPLAGFFPLGFVADRVAERATLKYYLRRANRYIGSPMLSALYGVWAAWQGDRRLSLQLFEDGYAAFATDRFDQILEYRPDKFPDEPPAAPFLANMGGFLLGCVAGLPGIAIGPGEPHTWARRPVVLPSGWKAIEIDRVWVRGQPARLTAVHGAERAVLELSTRSRS